MNDVATTPWYDKNQLVIQKAGQNFQVAMQEANRIVGYLLGDKQKTPTNYNFTGAQDNRPYTGKDPLTDTVVDEGGFSTVPSEMPSTVITPQQQLENMA